MTTARPVRLGFVGCGDVFGAYMQAATRLVVKGQAVAAAACGRAHQRERALSLGVQRFSTDLAEVLEADDVDVVIVLLPMTMHAEVARRALRAGKHVLCEKPLAGSVAEAQELAALAVAQGKWLVPAPFTTLSPTFAAVGARLRAGDLGRLAAARGRYGWSGPSWSAWFYQRGGGALFDLAVYNVTTLTGWLGPVRRVVAMTGTAVPERDVRGARVKVEVDDNAQLVMELASGGFAAITSGFTLQQYRGPALELYGSEGTLQMLGDDWNPDGYEIYRKDTGAWRVYKEGAPGWSWTSGLDHLVGCLRTGATPLVTPAHAVHVIEILNAAQEAARTGTAQALTTTFTPPAPQLVAQGEAAHLVHDRTRDADGTS